MPFETLGSKKVFQGRVFDVLQEQVRMPDGRVVIVDMVTHHGAVTLLPVDEEGQVWFVRQYRHPAGKELLELPAGAIEAGEPEAESAGRELREETGMAAGSLVKLGEFYLAPGYSTEYMHVFLATSLSPDPLEQDEDELLSLEKVPAKKALAMAERGEIQDAKTLAALLLARPYFEKDWGISG